MASLRTRPGTAFYWACFTDASGKRCQKSTGTTHRREAQKIADAYEAAAQRKFTVAHVQRTLRDLMADATGMPVPGSTVAEFFADFMAQRRLEKSHSTVLKYDIVCRHFLTWVSSNLPQQGRTQMAAILPGHVNDYRSWRLPQVSSTTVNDEVKMLRQIFACAQARSLLLESPFAGIGRVTNDPVEDRRPFTLEEVRRVLAVADEEWRSMILFGLYTGQRLGDVSRLDWKNVNLERFEVSFRMAKTGRWMIIPLAKPLIASLASVPLLERLGPVHPRAAGFMALRRVSYLSGCFRRLLVCAEILPPRSTHKIPGKGDARRSKSELSFHTFRHTATSLLRDSGAPVGVSMELIGHSSASVHRTYSHLGADTLRRAVSLLPTL